MIKQGEDNYRKLKDQYQQFYEEGDIKDHEEYEHEEIVREGEEEDSGFAKPLPRRAKSDGEIILNYQFDLDDSEDDNNISLHGEYEEYFDMALDKKNYHFENQGMQGNYFEVNYITIVLLMQIRG